jgi:hypothetical protein
MLILPKSKIVEIIIGLPAASVGDLTIKNAVLVGDA